MTNPESPTQQKPAPAMGQRWRATTDAKSGTTIDCTVVSVIAGTAVLRWQGKAEPIITWESTWAFAEMHLKLTYLGPLPGKAGEGWWRAGARDFPRRPPGKADFGQAVPRRDSAADPDYFTPTTSWVVAPTVREVGAGPNGPWTRYDSLVDSDPFTSYRHRRENGVVVAVEEARGHWKFTFAEHKNDDAGTAQAMVDRDEQLAEYRAKLGPAANPIDYSPIDPTPGAGIPERRAYRTPSGGQ